MKRVFISYAHKNSRELAERLTARLREASLDAWRDDERIRGGDNLDAIIDEAIKTSAAVLFLITPEWRERRYTQEEAAAAAMYNTPDRPIRLIPVLCSPDVALEDLPLGLKRKAEVKWFPGDGLPDDDARSWKLLCAIEETLEIGPPGQWAAKWRDYAARQRVGLPALTPAPAQPAPAGMQIRRRRSPQERPSLDCGRDTEWRDIEDLYESDSHAVAVVTGPIGEAHDHFLRRIQYRLRHDRPRVVEWVNWRPRPATREEFRAALAEALDVADHDLVPRLRDLLATHNVIFMHDTIATDYDDEKVRRYYNEWLPALVGEAAPRMKVTCVQPVAWNAGTGDSRASLRERTMALLTGRARKSAATGGEQLAAALAQTLVNTTGQMEVRLTTVGDSDVEHFCKRQRYRPPECAEMMRRARRSADIRTSEQLLRVIDDVADELTLRRVTEGERSP